MCNTQTNETKYPKFIAFGNSLLDHSVQLQDDIILRRHKLNRNAEGEFSSKKLNEILDDVRKEDDSIVIRINPGGSALNSCRTLAALNEKDVCFFGAVGDDDNGWKLKEKLENCGLQTCFQIIPDQPTGTCVCLIIGDSRCCYANIGASKLFQQSFLETQLDTFLLQNQRQIIYVEGFFIANRFPVCKYLYESVCQSNPSKEFVINLSSKYIVEQNPYEIKFMVEHADIVIGNSLEFETLKQIYSLDTIENTVRQISVGNRFKIVIITNGKQPIHLYTDRTGTGKISSVCYDIVQLEPSEIIDTTGAGDSFVAGFFWAYLRQKSMAECVQSGIDASIKTIKTIGGSFADHC